MKHLGARWLWLQERTRAKVLHVVTVATALNSADLSTKFNPGRRFDELLMMFLLRIGVGMGLLWHVWRCVRLRLHVQALCKVAGAAGDGLLLRFVLGKALRGLHTRCRV